MSGTIWDPVSGPYGDTINAAAYQYNLPPQVLQWQLNQESSLNPNPPLTQGSSAAGIAQFVSGTAAQYNVDVTDPTSSIFGAAQYDSDLLATHGGSLTSALTAYGTLGAGAGANAGTVQNNWQNFLSSSGIPDQGSYGEQGQAEADNPYADSVTGAVNGGMGGVPTGYGVGGGYAATLQDAGDSTGYGQINPYGISGSEGADYNYLSELPNPPGSTVTVLGNSLSSMPQPGASSVFGVLGNLLGLNSGGSASNFFGEILLRVLLAMAGVVLILGGFYVAGSRTAGSALATVAGGGSDGRRRIAHAASLASAVGEL